MIRGLHGLFYSSEPEAMRIFLRDAVKLPFTDTGGGWLIFDLPEADLGVHPLDDAGQPPSGTHELSFYCDDITTTVADMRKRGVTFKHDPVDHGYGYVTYFEMPGGVEVQLYEPKYPKRVASAKAAAKAKPAAKAKRKATTKAKPAAAKKSKSAAKATKSRTKRR